MQYEGERHEERDQADALQVEDHEARCCGDYVLQLRAAIAAEEIAKAKQRSVLGADDQQAAGNRIEAMRKRHQEHGDDQHQIEQDHRCVGVEVLNRLLDGVDQRRDRDQIGDHVEDLEPAPGVGWIALRAGLGGELHKRANAAYGRQAADRAPSHRRLRAQRT